MSVEIDKDYIIGILVSFQSMVDRSAESLDVVSKAAEAGTMTPEQQQHVAKSLRNVRDRLQDLSVVLYALTDDEVAKPEDK
jgi:hypothetical protein